MAKPNCHVKGSAGISKLLHFIYALLKTISVYKKIQLFQFNIFNTDCTCIKKCKTVYCDVKEWQGWKLWGHSPNQATGPQKAPDWACDKLPERSVPHSPVIPSPTLDKKNWNNTWSTWPKKLNGRLGPGSGFKSIPLNAYEPYLVL